MLKLLARTVTRADAEPAVLRVTVGEGPANLPRTHQARLLSGESPCPPGFGAYLAYDSGLTSTRSEEPPNVFRLPSSLDYLRDGDVIRVNPRYGEVWVMYRRSSTSNSMLLTEQCNSNCLMCSQPPKEAPDRHLIEGYLQAVPLMDAETVELGITGGEPTLLGDDLFRIIAACRQHLPRTALHLLSNGRLFNYLALAQRLAALGHPDLVVGIPLYADLAHRHDFVVQARGAFDQTIRGIMNLERSGVRIELRVVLHKQTVPRLPQLAEFVVRNMPYVEHVALMGLEMMGYVRMNLDALWIDPVEYQGELLQAVDTLNRAQMNVSLYNHQLCTLDRRLWPFSRKSISDWKNEYVDECQQCDVKAECGGFFASSQLRRSAFIKAIHADESAEGVSSFSLQSNTN